MRCATCPLATGETCRGESLPRLCQLVDPAHRDYHPEYLAALRPNAYPSLATQAGNALGAAAKVLGRAATGRKVLVPAEEQARRLAICETCPSFDAAGRRCYRCGCAMDLKARLESFECPVGKW